MKKIIAVFLAMQTIMLLGSEITRPQVGGSGWFRNRAGRLMHWRAVNSDHIVYGYGDGYDADDEKSRSRASRKRVVGARVLNDDSIRCWYEDGSTNILANRLKLAAVHTKRFKNVQKNSQPTQNDFIRGVRSLRLEGLSTEQAIETAGFARDMWDDL